MGLMPYEYLTFAGKNLGAEFGVWISGSGTFDAPARDVSFVSVPGRNGDLLFDNGRFENITVTYPAFISRHFRPRIDDLREFMAGQVGYQELRDTYHPGEYRQAAFVGGLSVSPTPANRAGRFNLSFRCKPQRFMEAGRIPVTFNANGVIFNPTEFEAKPLIRCYGTGGAISVGGVWMGVAECTAYIDIDCELMEAYEGEINRNMNIGGDFPTLKPGQNNVSFSGFSRVEITPRWWRI